MTASAARYSAIAIVLHWLIALALAGNLALGFVMPRDASGFALFQLHKSIGITILLLSLVRLGWRLTHRPPPALEGGWEGTLAKAVHIGFYAFMILAPLTGWALVSTSSVDVPTLLYGVVPWPDLPIGGGEDLWEEVHELLAFGGIALFLLHVAGALRHHFLLHDGLLARMAPGGKPGTALALAAAVVLLGGAVYLTAGGAARIEAEGARQARDADMVTPAAVEAARLDPFAEDEAEQPGDTVEEPEGAEPEEAAEVEEPAPEPAGPPASWTIQPGGSLRFSVDNSGTPLRGRFGSWSGDIAMDPEAPESATIAIRIDLASATLGDPTQDQMLRGAEFLAASANPTATFRSSDVTRLGGNRYRADGTLAIKGASRPQSITFTLAGSGARRSVTGSAAVNRNAFSIGTGSNAANLGGTVTIDFAFDAVR